MNLNSLTLQFVYFSRRLRPGRFNIINQVKTEYTKKLINMFDLFTGKVLEKNKRRFYHLNRQYNMMVSIIDCYSTPSTPSRLSILR